MRTLAAFSGLFLVSTLAVAAPPFTNYQYRFGDDLDDYCRDVAIDPDNRGVFTGSFFGTTGFDPFTVVSAGNSDIILFMPSNGGPFFTFVRSFGGVGPDAGLGVATDAGGHILVTGYFSDTIDFGGSPLTSAGGTDVFLACFDVDGNHVWSLGFGGPGDDGGNSVAVDSSGNVVLVGDFQGTIDLGDGAHLSAGGDDLFVARYSSAGSLLWSQSFGGAGDDTADEIATGPSGQILVTGDFADSVDFGGGTLFSAGDQDIFVARYASDGLHEWSQRFGGPDADAGRAVGVASTGHVFLGGYVTGNVDFGGGPLPNAGQQDWFLVRMTAGGVHDWSQTGLTDGDDRIEDLAVPPAGYVVVAGGQRELFDVTEHWFFARYAADGTQQYHLAFADGGNGRDRADGVAVDSIGQVYAAGRFEGFLNPGLGPMLSAGGRDGFAVRYFDDEPVPVLITSLKAQVQDEGILLRWSLESGTQPSRVTLVRREGDVIDSIMDEDLGAGPNSFLDRQVGSRDSYSYRLVVHTRDGSRVHSEWVDATMLSVTPDLFPNYPNPFSAQSRLRYRLPERGPAVIEIFDAGGRRVRRLDEGVRSGGEHVAVWNGLDDRGRTLPSGVYLYRMVGQGGSPARRMTLVR